MTDCKPYIYESPDGGDTVYRRRAGDVDREIVREGTLRRLQRRSQLWREIFLAADLDPELQHMIDQIEVVYRLKHQTRP
jgi:diadenosine tetraphosphatase ApaH/serine/threonine PP2A family protein phosphatase